jgi:hypothetical protein
VVVAAGVAAAVVVAVLVNRLKKSELHFNIFWLFNNAV